MLVSNAIEVVMTYTSGEPAVPSDQDAILAREVNRALAGASDSALRVQVTAAGHELTTFDLPRAWLAC